MIERLRQWWRRLTQHEPVASGNLAEYQYGIHDGVDYSQPLIVPGWIKDDQRKQMVAQFVEDTTHYRSQFGGPYTDNAPIMPVTEDPLREWHWSTRISVLNNCHAAYHRNPLAYAAVTFTSLFVVGDGFNLSCKNKDVEKVLLDFIEDTDNAIRENELQAVTDLQLDGELITRFFSEQGETVIVPMRPWECEWIETEPGFFRRPIKYKFQLLKQKGDSPGGQETEQTEIPADQIQFVAINRGRYELRGRPELYRILPWLRADKEWLEDRARQNKWRNALLWHVRVAKATATNIAAVMGRWRRPPTPGSAYVSTDNEEVLPLTNNVGAGDAAHDGRSIRLMTVIGSMLPEYFFGDGENANLASATKQELPALTKFEAFQRVMLTQYYKPMFKRVIQNAVDAGKLPEMVEIQDPEGEALPKMEPCEAVDCFEVTYEPVSSQDLAALSNMLFGSMDRGILSNKTAQEKLGFDPHKENKLLDEQREAELEAMTQGKIPPPPGMIPDGMGGLEMDRPDDDESGNDNPPQGMKQNGKQAEPA